MQAVMKYHQLRKRGIASSPSNTGTIISPWPIQVILYIILSMASVWWVLNNAKSSCLLMVKYMMLPTTTHTVNGMRNHGFDLYIFLSNGFVF